MKRISICALIIAGLVLSSCGGGTGKETAEPTPTEIAPAETPTAEPEQTVTETPTTPVTEKPDIAMQKETRFKIQTSEGDMIIKLYDETPLHKANFIKLADKHFYDGILFHRVINGFMIQVGDPLTKNPDKADAWGTGGPGYTIPAEIVSGLTHKKGALAAARRGDFVNPAKESSGSQFYIVQDASGCRHLDGQYTIFGEVVEGLQVIDKIASKPVNGRDCPVDPIQIIAVVPAE